MPSCTRGRSGRSSFLFLVVAAVVAAMFASPAAQARPAESHTKASASRAGTSASREAHANRVLDRARSIFNGQAARAGVHRDATLALRDLMRVRGDLSGAKAAEARRLLSRPTDNPDPGGDSYDPSATPQVVCSIVCVHWVNTSTDAVDQTDTTPANGIPDFVDTALATMDNVHNTYVAAGYRAPEADGVLGGDARTDIYLANVGPQGLYGYCTSDDTVPSGGPYDVWAYCVLDNDYSLSEFPTNSPIENLQVTAAHEYFHAVQFAYDAFEDGWFMEATATWAEDELYTDVNDNLNYLPSGPLGKPRISLDDGRGLHQYGTWIFFRYLTERFPTLQGALPSLILDMWKKADGSAGAQDQYSLQAVSNTLAERGTNFTKIFAQFADANRTPASTYSEGGANHYPAAPLAGTFQLKPSHRDTNWQAIKLNHLTTATARFVPSGSLQKLKVKIDMADKVRGSAVIVTTYLRSGNAITTFISLNSAGDGAKSFAFKATQVKFIEVTQVNASGRFNCWHGSPFSCQGAPKDDNLAERIRGIASS